MNNPKLFVISGPSGVGKGTIVKRVLKDNPDIYFSVSATTRPPRSEDVDGVTYHFLSKEKFEKDIENDGFLEYAFVHEKYYGTPKAPVIKKLSEGRDVILEIDVQGAMNIKKNMPEAVLVFVLPPSLRILRERLVNRGMDSEQQILIRLGKAEEEMDYLKHYDYFVINDDLSVAVDDVKNIINAEHMTVSSDEFANKILIELKGEI